MKKLVLAISILAVSAVGASAADLAARPYTKAPAAVVEVYNWTGFYVGGHAGYDWGKSTDSISATNASAAGFLAGEIATSLPVDPRGFIGGGQAGYNWQVSPLWVVGLEADISWLDAKNTVSLPGPTDPTRIMTATEKLDWFGTVRGRLGVTPADRLLIFATGGLAYGHASLSTALTRINLATGANTCVILPVGGNNCQNGFASDTKFGWTVGGGLEWALDRNWTVKAEYLYYDLGSISHLMVDARFPAVFNASADIKGNIARAGVNYKFGGPIIAKY
jgi:outer membrane immunogenic protein